MQKILKDKGFDVLYFKNANLKTMKKTLRKFTNKLKNSGVGLFYYAGHGIEVDGKNYLIPTNANIPKKDEVEYEALAMNMVIDKMANSKNRLNLVILDACRNDPYSRSGSGGLAQINNAQGMYIAFATAPKSVASDGDGRNGLFTKHLIKNIKKPNLELDRVFKNVRKEVKEESNGKQQPWTSSSVDGDFYFNMPSGIIQENEKPNTFSLEINPTPRNAKITIVNIRKTYRHGMYLKLGKYIVKISKNGYLTKKLTINLRDNIYTNVKLEKRFSNSNSNKNIWKDSSTNLMWQDEPYTSKESDAYDDDTNVGKVGNWKYAKRYCSNLSLAGYNDWYLPNKNQLKYLYKQKEKLTNITSSLYWSSSSYASISSSAWFVDLYDGNTDYNVETNSFYVRCVRGRQ
jgi:hypothetical protein